MCWLTGLLGEREKEKEREIKTDRSAFCGNERGHRYGREREMNAINLSDKRSHYPLRKEKRPKKIVLLFQASRLIDGVQSALGREGVGRG